MSSVYLLSDRRLPFSAVLAEFLAVVLVFPLAAKLVAPALVSGAATQALLPQLSIALLLINAMIVLLDPPEPPVWNVARAIVAGAWRATLLFIGLLWLLIFTDNGGTVPVGLFVIAWALAVAASALLRAARHLLARRIVM